MEFQTIKLPAKADHIAPDGSEIRLFPDMKRGGLAHCTLLPGRTSAAVTHRSVEEIWYFIEGLGEIWRKSELHESVETVRAGVCVTVPTRTHFQFKNLGDNPLRFIIATMPPWPGPDEAERVTDHWIQERI